ncbi:MAG: bifunctional riboflavin kinase/FAD synthetase [Gammaproteobacteria bacterium]|nr:MAG: bifunctional riboflavin kinase/FAD synthetase [Gammaproteobacteria bacterium]
MELIRGLHNIKPQHHGCVATIGSFDGVHRGHQAVIARLAEKSREFDLPALVMTFEPQPLEYFQPDKAPVRLYRLRDKITALRQTTIDRTLCVEFDYHFAALEAEEFIDQVLFKALGVRHLVAGDDFRFGKDRIGDFAMLQTRGAELGFDVETLPTYEVNGERVSSTRIRHCLDRSDFSAAADLLGRPYQISGRVAHGDKIGRTIGIPTANIHLHRNRSPLQGIFVTELYGIGSEALPGVASIGTRPTVGGTRALLEVHLFDFGEDIYGRYVNIGFMKKLRDEEKFDNIEDMRKQIERDIEDGRAFFAAL